ncbi:adenosylcobyric acid synthase [Vagococcus lutrae]|uniref:Lipid II isoglutaminyl synthase (glutamine-hydrolyzing) subunit GatD n=1 Tax=Vagococcus lutrae TaxID=81947 RepID=A0AAE9XGN7_9ENTE|nr:adenosylcobyric acid synthase [Vagococcus lutrae]MDT2801108.1 adenosylcobyric acid synthase [Vagococcus lutrae]MDT2808825.1 adenosylcobyric acid synthase [Vagococcus lutrae]MDT2812335.1 adenosylcobyric acid synthase [Vagococcus lutrae]MDT2817518.1 adenosylcobyric acid synthase [Vagococcus lutrae]WCG22016.1 adenosylcobyric acid synthase [Vagococcus lutrae]
MSQYSLNVCHLYGNLLNTYGDNGNLLVLDYLARQANIDFHSEIISIDEELDETQYDLFFFGGGQDFEQTIVSRDIPRKAEAIKRFIEDDGVMLAICGGYQLLGHYYMGADGQKIKGISAIDYYTLSQDNNRFIGDVRIVNEVFNEEYVGFENHNGMTFLGEGLQPLGRVIEGYGNNGQDQTEGVHYRNTFGSYFHGPILARNLNLAKRILITALEKKYQESFEHLFQDK